jgi:hypothetical protein
MKPSDLNPKIEVGQYWFDMSSMKLHKVVGITDTEVMFDSGWQYTPPWVAGSHSCGI